MAMRGLQAYAVPSARAGQRPDPSARRDVLSGLLAVGFLLGIIGIVVLIVLGAPAYGEPASGSEAGAPAVLSVGASPSPFPSLSPTSAGWPSPTSPEPEALKGYRWPVRGGGQVERYYDWAADGRFVIKGKPVHAGLVITWFDGAPVKAAHKGTVVIAGRGWEQEAGYAGTLDDVYERLKDTGQEATYGVVVDDGNGYRSVYSGLRDLAVEAGQDVSPTTILGLMSFTEERFMVRYQLVRMDGSQMKVAPKSRKQGYPYYAHEYVDPLRVLELDAAAKPKTISPRPPTHAPRVEPPR
jgi:murein DD-endopeptidase MepM/ murein hydrolase activator NlpD